MSDYLEKGDACEMVLTKKDAGAISNEMILNADAATLAQMIANNKVTSRQATEAYIEQIKRLNPTLNFLVEGRFEQALEEASLSDEKISKGEAKGKLFGVPISMKESFHVEGMKTTGGLVHRNESVQQADANIVKLLKAEGAIILGKTNTPALCFCQETDNKLYGRTNNPWNDERTAGGSSGGEAVAIAVGGAAAGFGSDIGGSIRFPSHFNGVIGFKSGKFQVSSEGSFPTEDHDLDKRMLGIGPLTKTIADAQFLYNIAAKEKTREKRLEDFSITALPTTVYPLSTETTFLMDQIYAVLKESFDTNWGIPPHFEDSALLWQEIMSIDGAKEKAKLAFGDSPVKPIRSYMKELATKESSIHRYLSWALIGANLFKPSNERIAEIEKIIAEGDQLLDTYLDERILIAPVYHSAAPKHGRVYSEIFSIKKTFQKYMPYVAYANVWGLPALTIPVGLDKEGMPIGVQLISKNGNEDALFKLGEKILESFRGYVRFE